MILGSIALIIVSGCGRSTLSLKDATNQFSPVLGSSAEDIEFINLATYAQVEDGADRVESETLGLVALTSMELILAEGSPNSISEEEIIRIPFSEMEGFALDAPFVQILRSGQRTYILPYRWYSDTVDTKKLMELSSRLARHPVKTVASDRINWVRRVIHLAEGKGAYHTAEDTRNFRSVYVDEEESDVSLNDPNGSQRDARLNKPADPITNADVNTLAEEDQGSEELP